MAVVTVASGVSESSILSAPDCFDCLMVPSRPRLETLATI